MFNIILGIGLQAIVMCILAASFIGIACLVKKMYNYLRYGV